MNNYIYTKKYIYDNYQCIHVERIFAKYTDDLYILIYIDLC